jgi:hypothetical protein
MIKYRVSLSSMPGKSAVIEYEFKLTDENPELFWA